MFLPLAALVCITGIAGSAASPVPKVDIVLEARRRVQTSALLVAEQPRPYGKESERRSERVFIVGREQLGSSFNATETMAILSHMYVWLAGRSGNQAARDLQATESSVRQLLERSARAAHPEIAEGSGSRSAANWAQFILLTSN